MPNVIINLIANPEGLEPGIESLENLNKIDKATAEQFKATNKAFQDRAKNVQVTVSSTEKLANASKALNQSIVGGAIGQASSNIEKLKNKLTESEQAALTFAKSIESAKEQLSQLAPDSQEYSDLSKEIDAATQSFDSMSKAASNPVSKLKALQQTLDSLKSSGLENTEVYKSLEEEGKALAQQVDGLSDQYKAFFAAVEAGKGKLSTLTEGSDEYERVANEIAAAEVAMGNLGKEATSSRARLRQLRETLLQLEDAGLDGTQVFEDIAAAAGELDDQIGDTQNRIKVLASDTFKFDVAIQAVEGVTGAFSVAQGAAALLGNENEDLQKALLKVNAAMGILQGLQSIQNLLQKESALNIGATVALQKLQVVQTNLQAAAESRNIVVRYAAIVAQKALNFVMAANPAGVVLFAIAALATGLYALTKNTDDAAKAQTKLNNGLKISAELADEYADAIANAGEVLVAQLQIQGASEAAIRAQNIKTLQSQLTERQKIYDKANANYAKANQTFISKGKDASEEEANNRQEAYDLANDAAEKFFNAQRDLELARLEDVKEFNDEQIRSTTAAAEALVSAAVKGSRNEYNARVGAAKARREQQLANDSLTEGERQKVVADSEREIQDIREEYNKRSLRSIASFAEARLIEAKKGSKEEMEAQIELINARRALDLADSSLTAGERKKIITQANKEIIDVQNQFNSVQLKNRSDNLIADAALTLDITKQLEAEKAAVILQAQADSLGKSAEEQQLIEKQKQLRIKQIDEETTKAILQRRMELYQAAAVVEKDDAIKDEQNKQVLILQAQIDSVGKSAEERLLIEKKLQADIEAITIDAANRKRNINLIYIRREGIKEKDEVRKLELQKQEVIAQAEIDAAGKTKDEVLRIEEEKKNAILLLDYQIEQAKKARAQRLREFEINSAVAIASSIVEIAKNQTDRELAKSEEKENKKLELLQKSLDQGAITQEEYNQRSAAIQAEFDRKQRALRIRSAQQEKQLALFQAGIAQSLAVLSILKDQTIPFATKPIFIGLAVAQALAQLAAIASKPIPAFKTGTKSAPGGPSLIGEAGPELYFANGEWGYAAGPTILDLPKGAKVIPSLETEKILTKYDIPLPRIPSYAQSHMQGNIDYKRLAKIVGAEVGAAIDKMPVTINGYDADGPWRHTTTMQNRHSFIKNRFGRSRSR